MKHTATFLLIIIPLILTYPSTAQCGTLSYTCTVLNVYKVDKNHGLKHSIWQKDFKGSQFSISRTDGQIIGEVLPTLKARKTYIFNPGSSENSFKAGADFSGQFQLIEVQEFVDSEEKPFVAMSMGGAGVVTGVCR